MNAMRAKAKTIGGWKLDSRSLCRGEPVPSPRSTHGRESTEQLEAGLSTRACGQRVLKSYGTMIGLSPLVPFQPQSR